MSFIRRDSLMCAGFAVCCSVLQCVAVCCRLTHMSFIRGDSLMRAVCCSVLQCVAVCCRLIHMSFICRDSLICAGRDSQIKQDLHLPN